MITEPAPLVERMVTTVDYLRITLGDPGRTWLACAPLVNDPDALARLVETTKAERGTDRADVATSLFVQGYAFRIATTAIGSYLMQPGTMLDVSPAGVAIAIGRGRPNAVRVTSATLVEAATIDAVRDALVDGHLAPAVETAHRSCRIGRPLLWGNVASSCASAFSAFGDALPAQRGTIADHAEAFFARARPELRDAGRIVRAGSRFAWERRSCCLWYRTESAWMCEDCSLRPATDHQARYAAMRAAEAADAGP